MEPASGMVMPPPLAIAKVYGEPLTEVPHDLYIPPDALEVFLEQFEGPLDLLLYLIRKENIDVLDIPMAKLTMQYLEYVELMRTRQLELAAEYLLMAAMLIEIKSRMLLPRPKGVSLEEDPRAELVRRLLEYEQMKKAAAGIAEIPVAGRDYMLAHALFERDSVPRPDVSPMELKLAWLTILSRANVNKHHKITREQLSVRAHMTRVLRRLHEAEFVEFTRLFDADEGKPVLVVTFIAILELARESLILISQDQAYAPIYVRLRAQDITETNADPLSEPAAEPNTVNHEPGTSQ
jgi:segregation and condensation protein A